jgi:dihydrofolate synthase / folylpolyglutamate synthase
MVKSAMPTSDAVLAKLKMLHPLLIDLSLGRIERLLSKLGNPEARLPPTIHIAGTNGKGSVSAFLKAIFEAAGKGVHVYTSPHLIRFHERIVLANTRGKAQPIAEGDLVALLERTERVNAGDPVTFFEITTAAAFQAFADHPADVVILEVGLGGIFDATNVIKRPALTIVTPVSIDHTDKLGDTIAKIATAKAGIFKPDVQAVVSRQEPDALDAIRATGRRVRAPLFIWGEDYEAYEQRGRLVYQSEELLLDLPLPALLGRHQIINAGTAVAAALHLKALGLDDEAIERGLVEARWPARMQRLDGGPLTQLLRPGSELWLDGGHNPAGGAALAQTMADLEERSTKPLCLVVGMMGQKDARGFMAPFRGLARRVVTVPIPGAHERPFEPTALAEVAKAAGFVAESALTVETALRRLRTTEREPLRILICGSLYLAGHVLALQEGATVQKN